MESGAVFVNQRDNWPCDGQGNFAHRWQTCRYLSWYVRLGQRCRLRQRLQFGSLLVHRWPTTDPLPSSSIATDWRQYGLAFIFLNISYSIFIKNFCNPTDCYLRAVPVCKQSKIHQQANSWQKEEFRKLDVNFLVFWPSRFILEIDR